MNAKIIVPALALTIGCAEEIVTKAEVIKPAKIFTVPSIRM